MSEAATAQQWICESCGFIYDPEEGDPHYENAYEAVTRSGDARPPDAPTDRD